MRLLVGNRLSIILTVALGFLSQASAETIGASPRFNACKPIIELLGAQPDLSWIKADYIPKVAKEQIRPSHFDGTQALSQLPKDLRSKLEEQDENGLLKNKMQTIMQLRNWAEREIKRRILNLVRAPEGLRQLDLWVHDKNGKESGFAIRQVIKPDVGFFGVGHGNSGGNIHALYPFTVNQKPLIEVRMDVDKIIELYAKLPGVKKSKYIFYKTCSGGLASEDAEADAVRLARTTGVPVIAPMGVLYNNGKVFKEGERTWETHVETHVETEHTEKILPKNKAFRVFSPDGTSKPISFQKMKELIIQDEFHSRVTYTGD